MAHQEFRMSFPVSHPVETSYAKQPCTFRTCLEGIGGPEQLSELFSELEEDPELMTAAFDEWISEIGTRTLERLRSEVYREGLIETLDQITSPLPRSEVRLMESPTLPQLILVHELFGSDLAAFIASWDIREFTDDFIFEKDGVTLFSHVHTLVSPQGLVGSLQADTSFHLPNDPDAPVKSSIIYVLREDGADHGVEKTCYLDHISVAPVPESYNLATRMLLAQKDALQVAGFRDMRLYANIQVGGYFWATLGLDWNREKISDGQLQIILSTIEGKMEEALARVDPNTASDQQKDALQKTMLEWHALFSQETPPTPLEIARVGRTGPFFACGQDPADPKKTRWILCQHKKEAEELTKQHTGQRQSYHLGKIGLIGTNWDGLLELDDTGHQEGENLSHFETSLRERLAA